MFVSRREMIRQQKHRKLAEKQISLGNWIVAPESEQGRSCANGEKWSSLRITSVYLIFRYGLRRAWKIRNPFTLRESLRIGEDQLECPEIIRLLIKYSIPRSASVSLMIPDAHVVLGLYRASDGKRCEHLIFDLLVVQIESWLPRQGWQRNFGSGWLVLCFPAFLGHV